MRERCSSYLYCRSSLGHQAFQDKADDVAEKSKDIKELEQSMLKLKQMFEDLAQLIEMQSEQIDAIEVTIDEAADNVCSNCLCRGCLKTSKRFCLLAFKRPALAFLRLKPAIKNLRVSWKSRPLFESASPSCWLLSGCAWSVAPSRPV